MTSMNHPLIRYHGGKFRIADWIISKFPAHKTYVEPFGGGGSVLLCKPQSNIEVYNDIDSEVVNLFRVLRDPKQCEQLKQSVHLTPFSREEFHEAYEETDCAVEKARRMIVRAQMGFGSAGATKGHTGFRLAGGRQKNYEINLWDQYPQRIAKCAERFKQCVIENQEASKVISLYDAEDTLFFVDPPYVRSTRTANVVAYRHEMTDADHEQLLDQLINVQGSVIITGYDHDLYNQKLSTWTKFTKSVQASGRLGGVTRKECLWVSPKAQSQDLFGGIHV